MTLTTEDFDYDLPHELIAQTPIEKRDASRLLVMDHETGELEDEHFYNIIDHLNPGDAVVMNDSRVMPARIYGVKQKPVATLKFYYFITRKVMNGKP